VTVKRDFRSSVFFNMPTPPRALIHGLKPFAHGFVFAKKIDNIQITGNYYNFYS
jgi:hypothetical protein